MTTAINGRDYDLHTAGKPRSFQMIEPGNIARIEIRPGDVVPSEVGRGVERAELCGLAHFKQKVEIEFDLMVEPGSANTAAWLSLGQFHQDASPTGHAAFALELSAEEFRLVTRNATNDYIRLFTDAAFKRGQWYWFKIQADFVNGSLDIWRDSQQVAAYRGAIGFVDPNGGYWKAGIYRAPAPQTMVASYRGMTVSGS